jgi:hypothetical protein
MRPEMWGDTGRLALVPVNTATLSVLTMWDCADQDANTGKEIVREYGDNEFIAIPPR